MLNAALCLILAVCALASLAVGPAPLSPGDVLAVMTGGGEGADRTIVMELRLPRTVLAAATGATLAMAGAALQGLMRNPLASPSLLGTSNAAALGAVLMLTFGIGDALSLALPLAAIASAFAAAMVLLFMVGRDSRILTLILAGLALSSLASALTALALNLAPNPFAVLEITFWLLGSFSERSMQHVMLACPLMAAAWALLWFERKSLMALTLGEDAARTLGVNLSRVRLRVVGAVALGVGAGVAVAGTIGFIGLVVPHMVRPFAAYDPARILIPSGLAGAGLLLAADCIVRLIPSATELGIGVVTALIGIPFFLYLIFRERRGAAAMI